MKKYITPSIEVFAIADCVMDSASLPMSGSTNADPTSPVQSKPADFSFGDAEDIINDFQVSITE